MLLDTAFTSSYTNTGLTNDTTYRYTVRTLSFDGPESVDSVERSATPSTTNRPDPPAGLGFSLTGGTVTLTWDAVNDAVAYSIYRDDVFFDLTTETTYTQGGLSTGSYGYIVRALNDNRAESRDRGGVRVTVD